MFSLVKLITAADGIPQEARSTLLQDLRHFGHALPGVQNALVEPTPARRL